MTSWSPTSTATCRHAASRRQTVPRWGHVACRKAGERGLRPSSCDPAQRRQPVAADRCRRIGVRHVVRQTPQRADSELRSLARSGPLGRAGAAALAAARDHPRGQAVSDRLQPQPRATWRAGAGTLRAGPHWSGSQVRGVGDRTRVQAADPDLGRPCGADCGTAQSLAPHLFGQEHGDAERHCDQGAKRGAGLERREQGAYLEDPRHRGGEGTQDQIGDHQGAGRPQLLLVQQPLASPSSRHPNPQPVGHVAPDEVEAPPALGHGSEAAAPRGLGWPPVTETDLAYAGVGSGFASSGGTAGRSGAGGSAPPSPGPTRGSHSSHFGRYQFQSPSSFIVAGSSTPRMIVASISTATASPTPSCLKISNESVAKIAKTEIITIAALVTTPAVVLIPCVTASSVDRPRSKASRIRVRMNTW